MKINRRSSLDRISELPNHIIEIIVMFLPMRDMVRTSILSKSWRFRWAKVPRLIFEDDSKMFPLREDSNTDHLNVVFGILLQHHGPIREFKLNMSKWCSCLGIDKIVSFLSRNGIESLTLITNGREPLKLPSTIVSCVGLKYLLLQSCIFQPLTLVGFTELVTLKLLGVRLDSDVHISGCPVLEILALGVFNKVNSYSIDAPKLRVLLLIANVSCIGVMKCPLLQYLYLGRSKGRCIYFKTKGSFIQMLCSLPRLKYLSLFPRFCWAMTDGDSTKEFPTVRNNLETIELNDIDLCSKVDLSIVLWLIKSSPNLCQLNFKRSRRPNQSQPQLSLQTLDFCHYSLEKLQEVNFELTTDLRACLEFFKFLLAVSPELKTLYIKPNSQNIDMSCCKSFLKLTCAPRASPKAEIVFVGLDLDKA